MKNTPLVSVAVVTYNQEAFVEECLNSILSQDYKNFKIVVADDGSTDQTPQLLRQYAEDHPGKFELLLSPDNHGVTANQNFVLTRCDGEYISWMAGDDMMLPGKLSKQVAFLENNPECAVCYHDMEIFNSSTGHRIKLYSDVDKPREGTVKTLVRFGAFNGAVSNMVRASCQPSPAFDARVGIASDWLYWVQCLLAGGRIGYIDEVLARHRRHEDNVTSADVRNPAEALYLDHLISCDIILSQAPNLFSELKVRRAYLLLSLRWAKNGKYYRSYLRGSLFYRFRFKVFVAYLANICLRVRV